MTLTFGLSFLAGLLSFLSPCVLPLVPAYLGYLSGRTLKAEHEAATPVRDTLISFVHGLAFVVGFSIVFIALGAGVSALGGWLYDFRLILSRVGGLIVVIFGIHLTGLVRIPFLEQDLRASAALSQQGLFSSMLMGILFSAGWSPCVGPVLGAILTLSLTGGSAAQGALYLAFYSAGLAIPFLIASLLVGPTTALIRRYGHIARIAEIIMGVLLIIIGVMLATGTFARLAQYGTFLDFGL